MPTTSKKIEDTKEKETAKVSGDVKVVTRVKKVKKAVKVAGDKKVDPTMGNAYKVLVKPLVTEKNNNTAIDRKYPFSVALNTNKIEISKAIKQVYGVKPMSVNIIRMKGKRVNRGKIAGKRKDWKKAIVTLPKGSEIIIHEGV
ncbi:MAG: 50S ribosomal protein L23 [Candidatus Falkowbacteria bacterium]|nr:50S ribosomal protein L23 [Candidatus Falkowbacteria bacterium]